MRESCITFLLGLSLFIPNIAFAENQPALQDRIISSTFKSLAKAFVAVADIDKIKRDGIAKVNKMSDEKFRKKYSKVYGVIKDLPAGLKASYGITPEMTRDQAIKNMHSLDKQKIYAVIDLIPDSFIADQFRRYLAEKKEEMQKSNLIQQINRIWSRIIQKISPRQPIL